MITYHVGDAGLPVPAPPGVGVVIFHVVNDVPIYGAGFSGRLGQLYPAAMQGYLDARPTLGDCHVVPAVPTYDGIWIAHLCAQHGLPGRKNLRPFRPEALRTALQALRKICQTRFVPSTVLTSTILQGPRVGTGYGGSTWGIVEPILASSLGDFDVRILTPLEPP